MTLQRLTGLALLLMLIGSPPAVRAGDVQLLEDAVKVVRLAQEGVGDEVEVETWLKTGEFKLTGGLECFPPRYEPGPAPDPYPHVHVWEPGFEQLGQTTTECNGIMFLNGKFWVPNMKIFMIWRIRIPHPSQRTAEDFEQDLDLAFFVDWNLSGDWEKNEQVINTSLNLAEFFPNNYPCLEIWYLTWFRVPHASAFTGHCGGIEFFKEKLWTRGVLSHCDPDASPNGESVFGEVEGYQVTYFEVIRRKGRRDH